MLETDKLSAAEIFEILRRSSSVLADPGIIAGHIAVITGDENGKITLVEYAAWLFDSRSNNGKNSKSGKAQARTTSDAAE